MALRNAVSVTQEFPAVPTDDHSRRLPLPVLGALSVLAGLAVGGAALWWMLDRFNRLIVTLRDVGICEVPTMPTGSAWRTGIVIGVAAALMAAGILVRLARGPRGPQPARLLEVALPVAALLFVIYQGVSGALFATTNITLEWAGDLPIDPTRAMAGSVRATIDRGDNWLTVIPLATWRLGNAPELPQRSDEERRSDTCTPSGWEPVGFIHRPDFGLRMAPKESTAVVRRLPQPAVKEAQAVALGQDHYLSAWVVSVPEFWPVPSVSYAQLLIPGH